MSSDDDDDYDEEEYDDFDNIIQAQIASFKELLISESRLQKVRIKQIYLNHIVRI